MNKLTRDDMKDLTVRELIAKIKQLPLLRELLTVTGVWLVVQAVLFLMIFGNVIYMAYRISKIVLN